MKFYSQYNQDKWLYENYFNNKEKGTFMEIGAYVGAGKSNNKFFEETQGWGGVCVEPSPTHFKLLEKNRNCICEDVAISDTVGEVGFRDISGWAKGLSGIIDKYSQQHKNRITNELRYPQNKGDEIIIVKTELLSNILDKNGITEIDLCRIETEGGEFGIVKSIDLD